MRTDHTRARRAVVAALVAGLLATGGTFTLGTPTPARAAGTEPTTTTIEPFTVLPGFAAEVVVVVTSASGAPTGSVDLVEVTGGVDTLLDSGELDGAQTVALAFPAHAAGTYQIEARYAGDATFDVSTGSQDVVISRGASQTQLSASHGHIETHHPVTLTATVAISDGEPGGSVTFRRRVNGGPTAILGTVGVANGEATLLVPSLTVGGVTITATWSGDASFAGSTSAAVAITVVADVVHATGIGISLSTFYPVRDKYRDGVGVRGNRQEGIGVIIRIYSPSGRLVRSATLPRRTGAYNYVWNGRTSGGTLLSAGRYRIVQTLIDAAGTRKAVTRFVVLSHKRLYFQTAILNKTFRQASRRSGVAIAWQFTIPKATVYRSMTVSIYGQSTYGSGGSFGAHDFTVCGPSTWNAGCATRAKGISFTAAWSSRTIHPTNDRYGRYVRPYAWANPGGAAAVSRVRLRVVYGVLR